MGIVWRTARCCGPLRLAGQQHGQLPRVPQAVAVSENRLLLSKGYGVKAKLIELTAIFQRVIGRSRSSGRSRS